MTSGGNNFNYFSENQLTKLSAVLYFKCSEKIKSCFVGLLQWRRSLFRIGGTEERCAKGRGGVGFLERGQLAPSPPAMGSGERCKLPQWGPRSLLILVLFEPLKRLWKQQFASKQVIWLLVCCHFRDMSPM